MGIERLNFSEGGEMVVAVAIGRTNAPPRNTHTGVIYEDRGGRRMIHLGWRPSWQGVDQGDCVL
jgi:hypothetical protein